MSDDTDDDPRFRRPRHRGECRGGIRPCPWVSCSYNLTIDVLEEGALIMNADIKRPEARGRAIVPKRWADELFADQLEDFIEFFFDEPTPPRPTCALDEAERVGEEGMQLDEISTMMYVTRERVRQIEADGLALLRFVQDFANLNPNDPDDDHEHVAYVCRKTGCEHVLAECPCTGVEKRIEESHRYCPTCKAERDLADARDRLLETLRDETDARVVAERQARTRCG